MIVIIYAIVWWAAEIAAWVYLGYRAAAFGAAMSIFTSVMIALCAKHVLGMVEKDVEEE